jgi:hypothetical protein
VSGSEQPSREELLALIEAQARMIEQLQVEIVELKRRLGRNSGNSSQPPSRMDPQCRRRVWRGGAAAEALGSSPGRVGRRCSRPATRTRSSITSPMPAVAAAAT